MTQTRAAGDFDVKLEPQSDEHTAGTTLMRLTIDKQFYGDLQGASKGMMLAARTAIDNSAGYVAIEQVTGALAGKRGSFVLQHSGISDRGVQSLDLRVVPDSGTAELAGLSGTMRIIIDNGAHAYEFDYELAQ
jgi:Protein of unknown function (DUF3224)